MKFYRSLNLLIILILFFPHYSQAGWHFISPMPKARYGHDATLGPDGKIYVMGGFVWYLRHGEFSNICYDRGKDKWTILEPVPGSKVYNRFWLFDKEQGRWRALKKVHDSKFMIIQRINKVDEKWVPMTDPVPEEKLRDTNYSRQGDGTAIVTGKDGLIYWIGGGTNTVFGNRGEDVVFPYNPMKMKWEVKTEYKRVYYRRNRVSGTHGGMNKYRTKIPHMLERRIDHEAVVMSDGKIYVMGGYRKILTKRDQFGGVTDTDRNELSNTVECYDFNKKKWEYKKPMPHAKFLFAAVVGLDDKIYTFGGMTLSKEKVNDIPAYSFSDVYDPKTDTWRSLKSMPIPLFGHAGVLGIDGRIYIMGGSTRFEGPPLKSVFIYDPKKDRWSKGPDMNLPRHSLAAVATPDGKIYAIGGTDAGAFEKKEALNFFLPRKYEFYTGKVQDTAEVMEINIYK